MSDRQNWNIDREKFPKPSLSPTTKKEPINNQWDDQDQRNAQKEWKRQRVKQKQMKEKQPIEERYRPQDQEEQIRAARKRSNEEQNPDNVTIIKQNQKGVMVQKQKNLQNLLQQERINRQKNKLAQERFYGQPVQRLKNQVKSPDRDSNKQQEEKDNMTLKQQQKNQIVHEQGSGEKREKKQKQQRFIKPSTQPTSVNLLYEVRQKPITTPQQRQSNNFGRYTMQNDLRHGPDNNKRVQIVGVVYEKKNTLEDTRQIQQRMKQQENNGVMQTQEQERNIIREKKRKQREQQWNLFSKKDKQDKMQNQSGSQQAFIYRPFDLIERLSKAPQSQPQQQQKSEPEPEPEPEQEKKPKPRTQKVNLYQYQLHDPYKQQSSHSDSTRMTQQQWHKQILDLSMCAQRINQCYQEGSLSQQRYNKMMTKISRKIKLLQNARKKYSSQTSSEYGKKQLQELKNIQLKITENMSKTKPKIQQQKIKRSIQSKNQKIRQYKNQKIRQDKNHVPPQDLDRSSKNYLININFSKLGQTINKKKSEIASQKSSTHQRPRYGDDDFQRDNDIYLIESYLFQQENKQNRLQFEPQVDFDQFRKEQNSLFDTNLNQNIQFEIDDHNNFQRQSQVDNERSIQGRGVFQMMQLQRENRTSSGTDESVSDGQRNSQQQNQVQYEKLQIENQGLRTYQQQQNQAENQKLEIEFNGANYYRERSQIYSRNQQINSNGKNYCQQHNQIDSRNVQQGNNCMDMQQQQRQPQQDYQHERQQQQKLQQFKQQRYQQILKDFKQFQERIKLQIQQKQKQQQHVNRMNISESIDNNDQNKNSCYQLKEPVDLKDINYISKNMLKKFFMPYKCQQQEPQVDASIEINGQNLNEFLQHIIELNKIIIDLQQQQESNRSRYLKNFYQKRSSGSRSNSNSLSMSRTMSNVNGDNNNKDNNSNKFSGNVINNGNKKNFYCQDHVLQRSVERQHNQQQLSHQQKQNNQMEIEIEVIPQSEQEYAPSSKRVTTQFSRQSQFQQHQDRVEQLHNKSNQYNNPVYNGYGEKDDSNRSVQGSSQSSRRLYINQKMQIERTQQNSQPVRWNHAQIVQQINNKKNNKNNNKKNSNRNSQQHSNSNSNSLSLGQRYFLEVSNRYRQTLESQQRKRQSQRSRQQGESQYSQQENSLLAHQSTNDFTYDDTMRTNVARRGRDTERMHDNNGIVVTSTVNVQHHQRLDVQFDDNSNLSNNNNKNNNKRNVVIQNITTTHSESKRSKQQLSNNNKNINLTEYKRAEREEKQVHEVRFFISIDGHDIYTEECFKDPYSQLNKLYKVDAQDPYKPNSTQGQQKQGEQKERMSEKQQSSSQQGSLYQRSFPSPSKYVFVEIDNNHSESEELQHRKKLQTQIKNPLSQVKYIHYRSQKDLDLISDYINLQDTLSKQEPEQIIDALMRENDIVNQNNNKQDNFDYDSQLAKIVWKKEEPIRKGRMYDLMPHSIEEQQIDFNNLQSFVHGPHPVFLENEFPLTKVEKQTKTKSERNGQQNKQNKSQKQSQKQKQTQQK